MPRLRLGIGLGLGLGLGLEVVFLGGKCLRTMCKENQKKISYVRKIHGYLTSLISHEY